MAGQLLLGKNTIGVGDRFAHQAEAQLRACQLAADEGVEVFPVWNKSNREHNIIGSEPASIRAAADAAVRKLGWTKPYFIDADHINFETVDRFLAASDFYTIDVADWIAQPAQETDLETFAARHLELLGQLEIPGASRPAHIDEAFFRQTATKYLVAVKGRSHLPQD